VLFALYVAAAVAVSPGLFALNLWQFGSYLFPTGLFLAFAGLIVVALFDSPHAPLGYLSAVMRSRGPAALAYSGACCLGMAAFWTLKFRFPALIPFWADPFLARLDHWLHFRDPWWILHEATPDWVTRPLLVFYFPIWLLNFFGCIVIAALHRDEGERHRYFLALFATYAVLGTLVACGLASVGPIFYDRFIAGDRYGALTAALHCDPSMQLILFVADRLYTAPVAGVEDYFAGISAMPSMHVALATLNALFLNRINRSAGIAGWSFLGITQVGSVYFGWHYAIDGYASIIAVLILWRRISPG
jgi:hypothetical protein